VADDRQQIIEEFDESVNMTPNPLRYPIQSSWTSKRYRTQEMC
jgi:hypothetical protein